jgi:hypothetical protein
MCLAVPTTQRLWQLNKQNWQHRLTRIIYTEDDIKVRTQMSTFALAMAPGGTTPPYYSTNFKCHSTNGRRTWSTFKQGISGSTAG